MSGFGWDLPPGVTEGMIPGNRPEDVAAQRYTESLTDEDLVEFAIDSSYDCPGCVIHDCEERGYGLESDPDVWLPDWPHTLVKPDKGVEYALLYFSTKEDALAYAVAFHDGEMMDSMTERYLEEGPNAY